MQRLRWQTLLAVFLVAGAVSTIGLRAWVSRGNNPVPIPWIQIALILVLSVGVALLGWRIRRFVGKGELLNPVDAVRTLVLGQATAVTGAIHLGYFTAQLVLALPRLEAPDPRTQAWSAGGAIFASVLMIAAGLFAEWCCRVPPDEDSEDPPPAGTADPHVS
ncbi:MAG TPA: DUF3180 domain-containing protein [Beutenbergiaceae bacterium]|nr:DUF3180 domain-containing protein [Beutenbergiaceae bacterium]